MLKKIALLLLLIAPMSVFAQKFGHIKSADVLTVMPEFTKAQTDIQAMQKQYEDEMKRATDELTKNWVTTCCAYLTACQKPGLTVSRTGKITYRKTQTPLW